MHSIPPGGSRSYAEPTGAASCASQFLSRVPPLPPPRPLGSLLPHIRERAPAPSHSFRASPDSLRPWRSEFSQPDTHTSSHRSPRTAESSPLTYGHQLLPQGIREVGLGLQDCKGFSGSRLSSAKPRPSFSLASSAPTLALNLTNLSIL
ncbi:hypothetical protein NDU88_003353 [Pleurodeles waltl]|uniref:Uncharacterized protein n=1 Tax=Pleurodeles waltl TaxID=8319 RepID=A0AAV7T514_PLEWA|nr:hypothetical protein NDU88_003353 [Pleurodeles waltl]